MKWNIMLFIFFDTLTNDSFDSTSTGTKIIIRIRQLNSAKDIYIQFLLHHAMTISIPVWPKKMYTTDSLRISIPTLEMNTG